MNDSYFPSALALARSHSDRAAAAGGRATHAHRIIESRPIFGDIIALQARLIGTDVAAPRASYRPARRLFRCVLL
ncbi:MAG: hypothetical protein ACREBX_01115 [Sphingopyxis sp.]